MTRPAFEAVMLARLLRYLDGDDSPTISEEVMEQLDEELWEAARTWRASLTKQGRRRVLRGRP